MFSMLLAALVQPAAAAETAQTCRSYLGRTIAPTTFQQVRSRLPVVAPKDQFESTAEYQRRLEQAQSPGSFPIVIARTEGLQGLSYNADRQELTVYPSAFGAGRVNFGHVFGHQWSGRADNFSGAIGFRLGVTEIGRESYEATNGFGARVTVERLNREVTAVWESPGERGRSPFAGVKPFSPLRVKLPPEQARDLVEHGRAAFLIIPRAPFIGTGTSLLEPSFIRPVEQRDEITALVADVQCAFLLNGSGGVVLALPVR